MAKYGLLHSGASEPWQTFDGESMAQNEEFVYIYDSHKRQVAAIKLADGQCVKQLQPER
jgi:hypothetical protein